MKHRIIFAACALTVCATLLAGGSGAAYAARHNGVPVQAQEKQQITVSAEEKSAFDKIESAKTPDAKLKLAGEFLKKYPKTQAREAVADVVVGAIAGIQDPAQRITLYESMLTTFNDPAIAGSRIYPPLVENYLNASRLDDAYRAADTWLATNTGEVGARTRLGLVAIIEAQKQNPKFFAAGQKYANEAIVLIEANKKPAVYDDVQWQKFKVDWLPQLHQALGVAALIGGNTAEAKTHLDKAVALNIPDPTSYALLADLADREYESLAMKHKQMITGAEKDAQLKKTLEQLDKVIELMAQAVAVTEGKPAHQPLRDKLMASLGTYYKYRKGSSEGLQQLIDKYKKAPATQ